MTTTDIRAIARSAGVNEGDAYAALDALRAEGLGVVINKPDVAVALLRAMYRVVDASAPVVPSSWSVEGPSDWRAHSRAILAQFSDDRRRVLGLFGFSSPLGSWESIAPLVRQMCDDQNAKGTSSLLRYPIADGEQRRVAVLRVYEGRGSVWNDVPVADGEQVLTDAYLEARPPAAPLWELRLTAEKMAHQTGIAVADAVSWLLSGEDVELPWIEASATLRASGSHAYTLTIGSLEVRPEEVADAWSRVRRDPAAAVCPLDKQKANAMRRDLAEVVKDGKLEAMPEPYRRTRVKQRNLVMADYVDAWKREHPEFVHRVPWKKLAPDFNELHPEFEPYTSETMRHKYWERRSAHKP